MLTAQLEKSSISPKRNSVFCLEKTQYVWLFNLQKWTCQRPVSDVQFDKMIYVLSSQQDLHLARVLKVLELMNYPWAKHLQHVKLAVVEGGGHLKRAPLVDPMIDVAAYIMYEKMKENKDKFNGAMDPQRVNREIPITNIKIQAMTRKRLKGYVFQLHRKNFFLGDSGAFLQYTHTRLISLQRNNPHLLPLLPPSRINMDSLTTLRHAHELTFLLVLLGTYPDVIVVALRTHETNGVVRFAFRLSHAISRA